MKPAAFDYHAPSSLAEAIALRAADPGARLLAGGQSLVPLMNLRQASPSALIDLNRVPGLDAIDADGDVVRVGAMVRQRTLETSPAVRSALPLLARAIAFAGHPQIRNRGTIGGSLAHADPAGEIPVACSALDAVVTVAGPRGERSVGVGALFAAPFATTLRADEAIAAVAFPPTRDGAAPGWSFQELARRRRTLVAAAVVLERDRRSGPIAGARIALGGVAGTPLRATDAEQLLAGADADAFPAAAAAVRAAVSPAGDQFAAADYRRHVAGVLVARGLAEAWRRSR